MVIKRSLMLIFEVALCVTVMAFTSSGSDSVKNSSVGGDAAEEETDISVKEDPKIAALEEITEYLDQIGADQYDFSNEYISIVSKGWQHQHWKYIFYGCQDVADTYGIKISFVGQDDEFDVEEQKNIFMSELNKKPSVIALAAIDGDAAGDLVSAAAFQNVPIIVFDSPIITDLQDVVISMCTTDNYSAGEDVAQNMFWNETFQEQLAAASEDHVVVIGIQAQDITGYGMRLRVQGFIDRMKELCESVYPGKVEVAGNSVVNAVSEEEPVVKIKCICVDSTDIEDSEKVAAYLLSMKNLIGIFCTDTNQSESILSITEDGRELDREDGKYKSVTICSFDSSEIQKEAIRKGYILGAEAQDPYGMGCNIMKCAIEEILGKEAESTLYGRRVFYSINNMDDYSISDMVYD